jgi:hypothetical protein
LIYTDTVKRNTKEIKTMTTEEKKAWLKNATNEELLSQLISFEAGNSFGKYAEDIELTRAEILSRMQH